jgi:hypothetical protein
MELEIWKLDDLHWAWKRKYSVWHRPLMLAAGYPKALIPFHVPNNITCLCVTPLSFHIEILLNQHGQSALDTSRTASCRLVMNHLIYVYVLSHPPLIYIFEKVCVHLCAYISFPARVPAPQLLVFHRKYLVWCIVVVYQLDLLFVYALLGHWFG